MSLNEVTNQVTDVRKRLPKQLITFQRLPSARPKGLSGNDAVEDRVQKRFLTIFISKVSDWTHDRRR